MHPFKFVLLIAGCAALLLAACDDSKAAPSVPPPIKSSRIEGVPLPPTAATSSSQTSLIVYRAQGMTFGELVAWYDRRMPEGQDWRDWRWCSSIHPSNATTPVLAQKLYIQPGGATLSIFLTTTSSQPEIVISTGEDEEDDWCP